MMNINIAIWLCVAAASLDLAFSFLDEETLRGLADRLARSGTRRCQKLKIENGRARYNKNLVSVRYRCYKGFRRYGARKAICNRGRWSVAPPVCVKRNCVKFTVLPTDVRVSYHFRGGVARFQCPPGLTLEGPSEVLCGVKGWKQKPPLCVHVEPPKSCDFEEEKLCGWTQGKGDNFDWTWQTGPTTTGYTGPDADHTYGKGMGGHYLYIEASSPRNENDKAILYSPAYPADMSDACFEFWYHMYGRPDDGAEIGSLQAYVKPISQDLETLESAFSRTGNKGQQWQRAEMDVSFQSEMFQIILVGVRGSAYIGDIAVDDVAFVNCSESSGDDDGEFITDGWLAVSTSRNLPNKTFTNITRPPSEPETAARVATSTTIPITQTRRTSVTTSQSTTSQSTSQTTTSQSTTVIAYTPTTTPAVTTSTITHSMVPRGRTTIPAEWETTATDVREMASTPITRQKQKTTTPPTTATPTTMKTTTTPTTTKPTTATPTTAKQTTTTTTTITTTTTTAMATTPRFTTTMLPTSSASKMTKTTTIATPTTTASTSSPTTTVTTRQEVTSIPTSVDVKSSVSSTSTAGVTSSNRGINSTAKTRHITNNNSISTTLPDSANTMDDKFASSSTTIGNGVPIVSRSREGSARSSLTRVAIWITVGVVCAVVLAVTVCVLRKKFHVRKESDDYEEMAPISSSMEHETSALAL